MEENFLLLFRFDNPLESSVEFMKVSLCLMSYVPQRLIFVIYLIMILRTGRPGFDPQQSQRIISSSLCVRTGSGAHPTSYPMGTGGPFPGDKARPDYSPPSRAEVKYE
jgi:hypothetical protein